MFLILDDSPNESARMPCKAKFTLIVFAFTMFLQAGHAFAQTPKPDSKQMNELRELGVKVSGYMRISMNVGVADQLEVTPEQRKKIQIAVQKYQDASRKIRLENKGTKNLDMNSYRKTTDDFMSDVDGILNEKQQDKLKEITQKTMKSQRSYDPEQAKEMQKLTSLMSELQQLSYNSKLAEELELTAEQRVEIREATQRLHQAMREASKSRSEGGFDYQQYNKMMGDLVMEAQEILTADQSTKLARAAKLKNLKRKFGDEFAMVKGLAAEFSLEPSKTKKLNEEIDRARKEFYDQLKQLKEDTLEKIIREVPKEHQEEVREAVGSFLKEDSMKRSSLSPFAN